ncbi:PqqD family protein [Sediminibacillus massiliensis]|uniref:PqqD family protein n=1 Tax=Sediminibacillus massiliensis TaxID=1926277 RepID=UPI0009886259|nr:PqqD family protein [Sediminibacillus massiliensis]
MTSYKCRQSFEKVELDGEWLVMNTDAYTVTTLNEVGSFCWDLLQEQQTLSEIVDAVKNKYAVQGEDVQHDVKSFVSNLIKCGLLEHAG